MEKKTETKRQVPKRITRALENIKYGMDKQQVVLCYMLDGIRDMGERYTEKVKTISITLGISEVIVRNAIARYGFKMIDHNYRTKLGKVATKKIWIIKSPENKDITDNEFNEFIGDNKETEQKGEQN